jgi:ProP effector
MNESSAAEPTADVATDVASDVANPAAAKQKIEQRNTLLVRLYKEFPVFHDYRPLAIGVHKALMARMPELAKVQVRMALQNHTAKTRYLKALVQGVPRLDLDGNPVGEVTADQQSTAALTLRDRYKKAAERRKAELEAQQRQEKLLQLAEKFNPH